jgi:hypothetical protein
MEVTPPTMSSSTHTPLRIFGRIRVASTYGCDPPCALHSAWPLCLACGDESPTSSTPSCTTSYHTSGSWLYGAEPMAYSACHDPCPLEVSDSFLSVFSSICLTSYAGFCSSYIVTRFVSYSGVLTSSTSTTTSTSCSLASVAREVIHVFLPTLHDSLTQGGDIAMGSRL